MILKVESDIRIKKDKLHINKNLKFLQDDEFCCAGVLLQQLVQSDLTVGLKVTHNMFTLTLP